MPRVLVVDDDPTMAVMMSDVLSSGSYQVSHVYDGVAALKFMGVEPSEQVKKESGETDWKFVRNDWTTESSPVVLPDLILLDCMMPRLDGLSLATELSTHDEIRGIPIIVLTTKEKMEEPFRQLSNVVTFLVKPPDPDKLLEAVGKHIKA
jgi:CheY-like chemotaxis protein